MNSRSIFFVALSGALVSLSPATAQDAAAESAAPLFEIAAGEHEIADLIRRSGEFLGRHYVLHEQDMSNSHQTTVRIDRPMHLDPAGCERVVGLLAYSIGFAMMPLDPTHDLWEWASMSGPRRSELTQRALPMTVEEVRHSNNRTLVVQTTVTLKHLDANAASNTLRPFFMTRGGSAALTIGAAGGSLLLSGFVHQVDRALQVLDAADVPRKAPVVAAEENEDCATRLKRLEQRIAKLEAAASKGTATAAR